MTHVVTDNRIKCNYMDCVEVCPVDCFYVGENMFGIHPDSASTAAFPDPECSVEAIFADGDIPSDAHWLGSPDADAWNSVPTSTPNISVRNAASAKAQASGLAPDPLPRSPAADDRTLERPKEKYEHVQCH